MNSQGHAAKGSNALVATVDFYSKALADALAEIEQQRQLIEQLTARIRGMLGDPHSSDTETP